MCILKLSATEVKSQLNIRGASRTIFSHFYDFRVLGKV